MENKKKYIILIVVLIIMLLCTLLVYILSKNNVEQKPTNNTNNDYVISNKITRLSSNYCYTIQKIINDYYLKLSKQDASVYNYFDDDFINSNNITKDNIFRVLNHEYYDPNFKVSKIFYNNDRIINYYFVNGYYTDGTFDEEYFYQEANFLVIIKNNYYVIRPLNNNIDIENYAKNYNIVDVDIKNVNVVSNANFKESDYLSLYIDIFKELCIVNPTKAYSMLGNSTKSKYYSFDEFASCNFKFKSRIYGLASEKNDNVTTYKIKDVDQNTIIITEYYPMDFKIDFEV